MPAWERTQSRPIQYPTEHSDRTVDRTRGQPTLFLVFTASAILQPSLLLNREARDFLIRDFIQLGVRQRLVSAEAPDSSAKPEPIVAASVFECRQEALTANQEIGAKGDAALDRVMLARVAFLERHPEQFDASVQSAIEELRGENRGPDEIEARAMQAEAFLARG